MKKRTCRTYGQQNEQVNSDAPSTSADSDDVPNVPIQPEVLPAVSLKPYCFALGRHCNDLETVQLVFSEFRKFNKGHEREADLLFRLDEVFYVRRIWRE